MSIVFLELPVFEEKNQPVVLYVSKTSYSLTVSNTNNGNEKVLDIILSPSTIGPRYGIYLHSKTDLTVNWVSINDKKKGYFVCKAQSDKGQTILGDPWIYDIVAEYGTVANTIMWENTLNTSDDKPVPWSPLSIDGETPHSLRGMHVPIFSQVYQKPTAYLKSLGLPSTYQASIAAAMYAAGYVSVMGSDSKQSIAMVHMDTAFRRIQRLLTRPVFETISKGVLLPKNLINILISCATKEEEKSPEKISPWRCCAGMLTALPLWTQRRSNMPWDSTEWNSISVELKKLCVRNLNAQLSTSALPYACVQFYPDNNLEKLMQRLSISEAPKNQMQQSFNRLKSMGVKEDYITMVARGGSGSNLESFGPPFVQKTDIKEKVIRENLKMLWRFRTIWSKNMTIPELRVDTDWVVGNVTDVYLAPFGCLTKPMVCMNDPHFAQFPISTDIFIENTTGIDTTSKKGRVFARDVNGTLKLQSKGNPLLIYSIENSSQLWAVGARKPDKTTDEYVRAVIFNIERLVQLSLLGFSNTDNTEDKLVFSNDDDELLTSENIEDVFTLTILEQILGSIQNFATEDSDSKGLKAPGGLPAGKTVPLGELVLASINLLLIPNATPLNPAPRLIKSPSPIQSLPPAQTRPHSPPNPPLEESRVSRFRQGILGEEYQSEYQSKYQSEFSFDPLSQSHPSRAVSPPIPIPTATSDHP